MDGYLETEWYNTVTQRTRDLDLSHPERVVRLRFWIDPVGPLGYQLTSEAVYRYVEDPSVAVRETEIMVPPGHAGEQILGRILESVRVRFGGGR